MTAPADPVREALRKHFAEWLKGQGFHLETSWHASVHPAMAAQLLAESIPAAALASSLWRRVEDVEYAEISNGDTWWVSDGECVVEAYYSTSRDKWMGGAFMGVPVAFEVRLICLCAAHRPSPPPPLPRERSPLMPENLKDLTCPNPECGDTKLVSVAWLPPRGYAVECSGCGLRGPVVEAETVALSEAGLEDARERGGREIERCATEARRLWCLLEGVTLGEIDTGDSWWVSDHFGVEVVQGAELGPLPAPPDTDRGGDDA